MIIGLSGIIPGGISVEDFSVVTKMNIVDSEHFLDDLLKNNVGTKQNDLYFLKMVTN